MINLKNEENGSDNNINNNADDQNNNLKKKKNNGNFSQILKSDSNIKKFFPYFNFNLSDIKYDDVPKLLDNYKQAVELLEYLKQVKNQKKIIY
ncbi:hypothetical protein M0812_05063 [Anaeramoeba flamelloides]|uniref:Uncharacterized protein n=1 Tax=Anaeramoeba flamelloides TaxID=1746091 RepID=A0AAV8ABX9_9EUKA|nr:hypothetical protein M0812_05063 [Anaeramoeba flamelloides]